MLAALFSAIQGIDTNIRGIGAVANNVANLNTDGYRAQRYDPGTDSFEPRHESSLGESGNPGADASDVELAEEFVDLMRYELGVRANLQVVRVSDRLTGKLLDLMDNDREAEAH